MGALTKRITYLLARITEMIFNNANNFMRMMVILTEGGFSKTSALYIKNFKHINHSVKSFFVEIENICLKIEINKFDTTKA